MMKKMMKMMKMTVVSVLLAASVCLQRTVSEHRLYGTVGMKLQWDCNYTGLITDIKTVSWQDPHKDTYMYQFNCQPTNCSHKCEEKSNPTNLVNILCDEISSGMFSLIFKKPNMTQNNTKYELRLALEKENDESKIICEVTLHLSDGLWGLDAKLVLAVAVAVAVLVGIICFCWWKKKRIRECFCTRSIL